MRWSELPNLTYLLRRQRFIPLYRRYLVSLAVVAAGKKKHMKDIARAHFGRVTVPSWLDLALETRQRYLYLF